MNDIKKEIAAQEAKLDIKASTSEKAVRFKSPSSSFSIVPQNNRLDIYELSSIPGPGSTDPLSGN